MAKRDYYEILGVQKNCSEAELKKAYRRAAQKHHPDRNPDNPEALENFKECKEAYEVLSDARKRAAYDQFGHAGVGAAGPGGDPVASQFGKCLCEHLLRRSRDSPLRVGKFKHDVPAKLGKDPGAYIR